MPRWKWLITKITNRLWFRSSIFCLAGIGSALLALYGKTFIPDEFGIKRAYPNPFNPSTQIEFSISEHSMVKLDVLDINGRLVDQIESGYYSPGVHTLSFNGNNHSSGLYFIRLQSSNSTSMHKVMLLK